MHDTPMHTNVGNVFGNFFQFWNNSDFSDFTQKCNFSVNYLRNWIQCLKCLEGSHMQHISNRFSDVTFIILENGNIDGGGRECHFSLTILNENCWLLSLRIDFSSTIDARIEKHECMVPLSIVIMATHLKFFSNLPFWYNSDFSDFTPKCK